MDIYTLPNVKKSKKGEVNYCPDPPEGQTPENTEEKRMMMEMEMLKKDPDHQLVEDLSRRPDDFYVFRVQKRDCWRSATRRRGHVQMASYVL